MLVTATTSAGPLSDSLREFVTEKLGTALDHHERLVRSATVRIEDINGAHRGGEDQLCRLVISLVRLPSVVIEERAESVFAAVSAAAERAGRAVTKAVDKRRKKPIHHRKPHEAA
ncbi:MAG: HPF/RaiA family ribosome-associated protein [Planctomycetota bacterium]